MANENKYTLPLGIDASSFFQGIATIDKSITTLQTGVADANKGMQEAFNKSVQSGESLEKTLDGDIEKMKLFRDAAKAAGKDLLNTLTAKGSGKELEEKIFKFQALLAKATKGGKVNLDVAFDAATVKEIQNTLKKVAGEMEHFKTVAAATKLQLSTMDPNSTEFAQLSDQLKATEDFMDALGGSTVEVEGKTKSLKAQLRGLKEELALMEDAGLDGTQRFEDLSIAAGQLEDQIGDTAARVRVLASDTKYIDAAIQGVTGLIGAMTAAQGAEALFGDENKDLQESLQKVTAAMAILQGVQAVANSLNKDSALSILFLSGTRRADVVATEAQTVATVAQTGATEAATVATNSFTAALLRNPITLVVVAIVAAVAAMYALSKSNDESADSVARLNRQLEEQKTLLEADTTALQRRTDLLAATAGLAANSEEAVIRIQGRGLQQQLAIQQESNKMLAEKINSIKGFTEEENKLRTEANAELIKGQKAEQEISNQIELKGIDLQRQRISDRKAIRDEILSLTKELRDAEIKGAGDQTISQKANADRAQARVDAEARIKDLEKEILRSAEAEKIRSKLIAAIRRGLSKELKDITRQENLDLQQLQLSAAKTVIDQMREGQEDLQSLRELDIQALAVEEQEKTNIIIESYKSNKKLQDGLLTALANFVANKRKAINLKFAQDEAEQQEQIQTASLNILFGFKDLPVQLEEEKQRAILKVQIEGAKKRLNALIVAGKLEGDVSILIAKEQIARLEAELSKVGAERGSKQSIFSIMGFDMSPQQESKIREQVGAVQEGLNQITNAYKQVTDSLLASNRQQIDSSNEKISAFQQEIDSLQSLFEKEDDFRKKGLANNAQYYEDQIALQKKAKDEEIANRHDLFEKQKALQRQQLIADTISQSSSLITASANIIEGFSSIPYIGVALGLAAVGVMIAGFIAAKTEAFNAINNQKETFGTGGTIDGESHAAGGRKYRALDGSGDVVELEGGEEVIRKSQAQKHRALLKAINEGASDEWLAAHLAGTGVSFKTDVPEEGAKASREFDSAHSAVFIATSGRADNAEDLKTIREDLGYLAQRKRDEVETWEDAFFIYEKKGNTTTKIKK